MIIFWIVDPYDNGLCQQLKALITGLDDGLVSCLCHMGVADEDAKKIVAAEGRNDE
jgi:hypothetical protein